MKVIKSILSILVLGSIIGEIILKILRILLQLGFDKRGYFAIGGEFLVIPLLYLINLTYRSLKEV